MRSTIRYLSIFCVILSAISLLAAVMLAMALNTVLLTFGMKFSIIIFLFTIALICLLLTLGLRSLCQDLDLEYESTAIKIRDLSKKISELEEKCK